MDFDPTNEEVFKLLTRLKTSNGAYPPELLAARKARYLQQVAQVGIAAGTGMGIKQILKGGNGSGSTSNTGTLLETVLVVAIVAGALKYFYRDKLVKLLNLALGKPNVEQTAYPPVDNSSPVLQADSTASPAAAETPLGTPSPVIVINRTVIAPSEVVNPVGPLTRLSTR